MAEECLLCKEKLVYLNKDEMMECVFCHKKELSKTKCINNHYVCNDCHTKGIDNVVAYCLQTKSKNPIEILHYLMKQEFCHMHGPEHHILVGASLLAAFKNACGDINLEESLKEMLVRGKQVPGGACGFWGACGAAISTGMFISIITKSTPLAKEDWGLSNKMTAKSLDSIGTIGGPRCCKRDSNLSILNAIDFVNEHFEIHLEKSPIICEYSSKNNQCIGNRCPFHPLNNTK